MAVSEDRVARPRAANTITESLRLDNRRVRWYAFSVKFSIARLLRFVVNFIVRERFITSIVLQKFLKLIFEFNGLSQIWSKNDFNDFSLIRFVNDQWINFRRSTPPKAKCELNETVARARVMAAIFKWTFIDNAHFFFGKMKIRNKKKINFLRNYRLHTRFNRAGVSTV